MRTAFRRMFLRNVCTAGLVLICGVGARAGDWTTYRGDIARRGATQETLPSDLKAQWVILPPAAPQLAWSSAEGRVMEGKLIAHLVNFDSSFQPVIAEGRVYYGSSVDHQLHCADLRTGETLWTFFTGGPIRLAPTLAGEA